EEFMIMIEEGRKSGHLDASEVDLIKSVFEMDDTSVAEIMTPITETYSVHENSPIFDVLPQIASTPYYRVPVYSHNKKDIVGVLYKKDLLIWKMGTAMSQKILVKDLMRRAVYVSPNIRL